MNTPRLLLAPLLLASSLGVAAAPGAADASFTEKDYFGREVAVPAKVDRVIPMDFVASEMLCMIGASSKIAAVGRTRPSSVILQRYLPGQEKLPVVGTNASVSVEKSLSVNPDLFICNTVIDAVNALDKGGIRVFALEATTDTRGPIEEILKLGRLVHKDAEAAKISEYLSKVSESVASRAASVPEGKRLRVYYARNEITETMSNATLCEAFEMCGAVNLARELGESKSFYVNTTIEQVYQWDPDVIIIRSACPYKPEDVYKDARLAGLRAVKEKRVYQGKYANAEFGVEMPFSLIEKLAFLHPELASGLDADAAYGGFLKLIDGFYK